MSEPALTPLQRASVLVLKAYEDALAMLATPRQRVFLRDILAARLARDIVNEELRDREEEAA